MSDDFDAIAKSLVEQSFGEGWVTHERQIADALRAAEARGLERAALTCDSSAAHHRELKEQYPIGSTAAFEFYCYAVQAESDARDIRALSEPAP